MKSAISNPKSAIVSPAQLIFANDLNVGHDGWAQLAPFGDFPGQAMVSNPDGSIARFAAIQRLDRAAAETMVARFKSPWQRMKRYFTGCHIYTGHPDVPAFANDYPDKSPKGMIVDLQVRANGLFCKPVFTREGSELVETRRLRAFSPYWTAREVGERKGPDGQPIKIFRPEHLNSAGLTNNPNLPVQLLNEKRAISHVEVIGRSLPPHPSPLPKGEGVHSYALVAHGASANDAATAELSEQSGSPSPRGEGRGEGDSDISPPTNASTANRSQTASTDIPRNTQHETRNSIMNKQLILDFLATQGITMANEAMDDQVAAALGQLGERVTIAETTLAGRSVELESLRADLANERQFHTDTLLDSALAAGRITAAQRSDWAARLQSDFANSSAALAQLPPTLKTHSLTLNSGARKAEIANAGERRDALDTLLKAEMAVNGGDYDRAFATVRKGNPALFAAMKQPAA